eukprot:scaffold359615_cov63-Attheya_sp.AAC.1
MSGTVVSSTSMRPLTASPKEMNVGCIPPIILMFSNARIGSIYSCCATKGHIRPRRGRRNATRMDLGI